MSHNHNIVDTDKIFTIDPITRSITTESGNKLSIMQYDHRSERITFEIPKMIEGHDMALCDAVQVHYTNTSSGTSISARQQNPGVATLTDLHEHPNNKDMLVCTWLISQHATLYSGTLSFLLKFICKGEADTDELEYIWHTNICSVITILPGLNNSDDVTQTYPDVLLQMEKRIDRLSIEDDEEDVVTDSRLKDLERKVADLLYDPIGISSFTNNANTVEIGSTVTSVTLSWALNKIPVSVTIDGDTVNPIQNGVSTRTNLNLSSNKTWTLKATDERGAIASKTTGVTFLNGVYYGVAGLPNVINSTFVRSLKKTLRSSKLGSFADNAGTSQYIWYCEPARFGTRTFTVNGFTGGFSLVSTFNFTNGSGYSENYNIYRSDNPNLGSTSVTVG